LTRTSTRIPLVENVCALTIADYYLSSRLKNFVIHFCGAPQLPKRRSPSRSGWLQVDEPLPSSKEVHHPVESSPSRKDYQRLKLHMCSAVQQRLTCLGRCKTRHGAQLRSTLAFKHCSISERIPTSSRTILV
jgi:hypothetical protein